VSKTAAPSCGKRVRQARTAENFPTSTQFVNKGEMLKPCLTLAKTGVAFVHNLLTDPERMRAVDAIDVFADLDGGLIVTWMFNRMGVIQENTRQDEGNAYARLGEVLQCLGREDEARVAYETGIRQAEQFGHGGMAEDLRLVIVQLRE
jgi:hypothetical protein